MKVNLLILVFFLSIFSVTCETNQLSFSSALALVSNYLRNVLKEESIPFAERVLFIVNIYTKTLEMIYMMEKALLQRANEEKKREEQRKLKEESFKKATIFILWKKNKSRVFLRF
jgi:hypothetical protein